MVKAHLACCLFVTMWAIFFLLHMAVSAPQPIAISVSPRLAFAPANLSIQVRVHPSPDDRWIDVQTDGGEFARRSQWSIEPSRTLYRVDWRDVPAGDYAILARLGHGDQVSGSDRVSVQLMGAEQ
jgi:hypothetical protein